MQGANAFFPPSFKSEYPSFEPFALDISEAAIQDSMVEPMAHEKSKCQAVLDSAILREPGKFHEATALPPAHPWNSRYRGLSGEAANAADSYEKPQDAVGCPHD